MLHKGLNQPLSICFGKVEVVDIMHLVIIGQYFGRGNDIIRNVDALNFHDSIPTAKFLSSVHFGKLCIRQSNDFALIGRLYSGILSESLQ